jgi:hypothetical protein
MEYQDDAGRAYGTRQRGQLYTLQRRVRSWRQEAVQRLIHDVDTLATDVPRGVIGNILDEAPANKIT